MDDAFNRGMGYIKAFTEHRQNRQQIDLYTRKGPPKGDE
jgi:hypothetical protein